MEKFWQAKDLLTEQGENIEIVEAFPASFEDLRRVHAESYLIKLSQSGLSERENSRLGFKSAPALFERCRYEVGGTLLAIRSALDHGLGANLAGGTHHAFPDNGQGFCLLNDVAVAIRKIQHSEHGVRVMVIDTDAHQGNGTHAIFRNDPTVFTYSIHVAKNYPSIKEPGDLDVGLDRWVTGEEYMQALAATLPNAVESFDPDLLIWISGADTHENDRFGQMRLTEDHMKLRDCFVLHLHRQLEIPTAVLYGGGYNRRDRYTAMLHAQTIRLAASM